MAVKIKQKIRARIAPSPTGYLHIGTARTALFNWLFAKKYNGTFILRIEDTDLERSDAKYEKDIVDSLKWLGLDWDEGPFVNGAYGSYRQSERLDIYEKYLKKLLEENLAYYCFCAKELLEEERKAMLASGLASKYSGRCRALAAAEIKKKLDNKESHVIRFKVPEATLSFKDLIRGQISFDTALMGDIAIAKDLRTPLYNFAVVVDDYEMEISHVIRGEDHIANTPKQILLQKALGFSRPEYGHLPLILDPDRSKISKRYSATSIKEYREAGYLPDAMVNFMALLGWHPKEEKEILGREELIQKFELERVQKAGAVFNVEKLNWINSQYIKAMSDEELAKILQTSNLKIISLVKERMKKLSDFGELAGFLLKLPDYSADLLIWKSTPANVILGNLQEASKIFSQTDDKDFNQIKLFQIFRPLAQKTGNGEIFWPLRVALSGLKTSPGPLEIAETLGKNEALDRVAVAIKKLQEFK